MAESQDELAGLLSALQRDSLSPPPATTAAAAAETSTTDPIATPAPAPVPVPVASTASPELIAPGRVPPLAPAGAAAAPSNAVTISDSLIAAAKPAPKRKLPAFAAGGAARTGAAATAAGVTAASSSSDALTSHWPVVTYAGPVVYINNPQRASDVCNQLIAYFDARFGVDVRTAHRNAERDREIARAKAEAEAEAKEKEKAKAAAESEAAAAAAAAAVVSPVRTVKSVSGRKYTTIPVAAAPVAAAAPSSAVIARTNSGAAASTALSLSIGSSPSPPPPTAPVRTASNGAAAAAATAASSAAPTAASTGAAAVGPPPTAVELAAANVIQHRLIPELAVTSTDVDIATCWHSLVRPAASASSSSTAAASASASSPTASVPGEESVLGFDIEWPTQFLKGVAPPPTALIQLAFMNRCYLFHVTQCGVPASLRVLLESALIKKCGVNVNGDVCKLRTDFGIRMSGITELNDIAQRKLPGLESRKWSLAALTEHVLRRRLEKDPSTRLGNWAHADLSGTQLTYAATDAWIGVLLYYILIGMRDNKHTERAAASRAHLMHDIKSNGNTSGTAAPTAAAATASAAVAAPVSAPQAVPIPKRVVSAAASTRKSAASRAPAGAAAAATASAGPGSAGYLPPRSADEPTTITPYSMPACNELRELTSRHPPTATKLESWRLFQSGMSCADIAKQRRLVEGTILGHVCAIAATGEPYEWARFGVDDWRYRMIDTVCEARVKREPIVPVEISGTFETVEKVVDDRLGELKSQLPIEVSYAHIRAVLVHRFRLRWRAEEGGAAFRAAQLGQSQSEKVAAALASDATESPVLAPAQPVRASVDRGAAAAGGGGGWQHEMMDTQ